MAKIKVIFGFIILVAIIFSFNHTNAQTKGDIMLQIQELKSLVLTLEKAIDHIKNQTSGVVQGAATCTFTRNLSRRAKNNTGEDVKCLQQYLIVEGFLAEDNDVGVFGRKTKMAVCDWQLVHGLITQADRDINHCGYFGKASRAKYDELMSEEQPKDQYLIILASVGSDSNNLTVGEKYKIRWGGLPSDALPIGLYLVNDRGGERTVLEISRQEENPDGALYWTVPEILGDPAEPFGGGFRIVLRGKAFELSTKTFNIANSGNNEVSSCTFTRNLSRRAKNNTGEDVKCLQQYLIAEGYLAPGNDIGVFGRKTKMAVCDWQLVHGLITQADRDINHCGYFGKASRAKYDELINSGSPDGFKMSFFGLNVDVPMGETGVKLAKIVLDNSVNTHDTSVESLNIEINANDALESSLPKNCEIKKGGVIVAGPTDTKPNPGGGHSLSFSNHIIIAKNSIDNLELTCRVAASARAGDSYELISFGNVVARDVFSGEPIIPLTGGGSKGLVRIVNTGSLSVSYEAKGPGYSIVAPGTEVVLLSLKFSAENEDIDLQRVAFQLADADFNTPLDLVGRRLTLWDGATQIGLANFPIDSDYAESSIISEGSFRVPKNGFKNLIVKGVIADITPVGPLTKSGDLLKVSYDADANGVIVSNYGIGVSSRANIMISAPGDLTPPGVRIMNAYPVFTKMPVPSNVLRTQADYILYRFRMEAVKDDLAVRKWTFTIDPADISAQTSQYGLYAYTDSSYTSLDESFATTGLINSGKCYNEELTEYGNIVIEIYPEMADCDSDIFVYEIPYGAPRYFELRATVASVETTTDRESLSIVLDGDSAFPVGGDSIMKSASGVDSDLHDDFIWSPMSNDEGGVYSLDWTNGYAVSGLSPVGLSAEVHTSI